MEKLGRNDICHCGSGKKYKRCCLDKDEAGKITRLTSKNSPVSEPQAVQNLIEHELMWESPLYQIIAKHTTKHMTGQYPWDAIKETILLWHAYSSEEMPILRKAGVFPAALEYCAAVKYNYTDMTQSVLAEKYGVSAGTISKRAGEIMDFALLRDAFD